MCKDVRLAHQIRTILLKISFLWEADVDVEELGEVSEKNAVHSGRRLAQEVVLVVQQIGNRFQVLERHLPDLSFCVPSYSLQIRPERYFLIRGNQVIFVS